MSVFFQLTGPSLALIAAGLALFFISGFVLWGWRWGTRFESGDKPRFSFPGVGDVSEPTRLLAGFFGLVVSYHLVVWALPSGMTYMQFPRTKWWVVMVVGSCLVGVSLLMDKNEKKRGVDDPGGSESAAERSDHP